MFEEWKPIEDYPDYMVSNLGRVKSCKYGKERILKFSKDKDGYLMVNICKNGKQKTFKVHRLVAEAFIPNIDNKSCIDHFNTIKSDNRVDNLRWVTYKENMNNPLTKEKQVGKIGKLSPSHKPILQFDKNMNFIRKWECIMEVERDLDFNNGHISKCCNGKLKTAYGFKWAFESEYELIPFKVFDLKIYKKRSA